MKHFSPILLGLIAYIFYSVLIKTLKIKIIDFNPLGKSANIYGVFHGQFFLIPFIKQNIERVFKKKVTPQVLVSPHRDGEILHYFLKYLRIKSIRGDNLHQAISSLKKMIRKARENYLCVIALDGPVGPYHSVSPGIIAIAKASKRPINIVFSDAKSKWTFNSWDKMMIPKPFTTAYLYLSKQFFVDPKKSLDENLKIFKKKIKQEEKKFMKIISS